MIKFDTPRLKLRNYKWEDFEDIKKIFQNAEVARYEDFNPMSDEELKDYLKLWIPMENRWVVCLKKSEQVIGSIGYWIDEAGNYSIDYDFNPEYQGEGYATEASIRLLRHLFEEIGITEIYGDCDTRNTSSWRLLERLGFHRIKTVKDTFYKKNKEGEELKINIYLYNMRQTDWLKKCPLS